MSGSRSPSPNHRIILKNTIILAEALRRLDAHRDRLALTRTDHVSRRPALRARSGRHARGPGQALR